MSLRTLLHLDLFVFLFLLQLPIGSLALLMLYHLTGGRWGAAIQPALERTTRMFAWLVLLLLPVLLLAGHIYPWARGLSDSGAAISTAASSTSSAGFKAAWLSYPFVVIRAALYFTFWIRISSTIRTAAGRTGGDETGARRLRKVSAAGSIVHGFAVSFAAVDWAMSLEPDWYSNAFGLVYFVSSGVTALAWAVMRTRLPVHREQTDLLTPTVGRDLGNLLLAFTLLWAYVSFSQYLVIWLGKLPEETAWYVHRTTGVWRTVANILVYAGFAFPFTALLFRKVKDSPLLLRAVSLLLIGMHGLEQLWIVLPASVASLM